MHRQLELFLLFEMGANHVSGVAQHLEEKAHFFVDRLGRGLLSQSVFLIAEDRSFVDIDDQF